MKIQIKEKTYWQTEIRVTVFKDSRIISITKFKNLITDIGLDSLVQAFSGNDTKIKYVALGNDDTAPANSDTKLGNELFRKAVTKYTVGTTGKLTTQVYIAPGEANSFTIKEIGWFAGAATSEKDTGTMIARVLYSHAKNDKESLLIERTDTLARGV